MMATCGRPKAGIGVIVSQTGCPVVPAYIEGTFDALPTGCALAPLAPRHVCGLDRPWILSGREAKEKGEAEAFYEEVSRTVIEHIAALGDVPVPKGKDDEGRQTTPNRTTAGARNAE